jgi:hypothetical protein
MGNGGEYLKAGGRIQGARDQGKPVWELFRKLFAFFGIG